MVATVDQALARQGLSFTALERWKAEMPTEAEMLPKDKYTMFDRKAKRYRKGIHSAPNHCDITRNLTDFILHRAAQMDPSIAETQPSRLLKGYFEALLELYTPGFFARLVQE